MLLAHLSDLHLRDDGDAAGFEQQLDCIASHHADHLTISGDLLDRWDIALLHRALDALAARQLLAAARLTIIPGNHDFASSGGHPRASRDLWRLAARFWDPPPLVARRRRRFHDLIAQRAPGVAPPLPFRKQLPDGYCLAAVNTVTDPWLPVSVRRGTVTLEHARGIFTGKDAEWLANQRSGAKLIVLAHHYPLDAGTFRWQMGRTRKDGTSRMPQWVDRWPVDVPMDIREPDRSRFWTAVRESGAIAVVCGHVHRARLEYRDGVAVLLNGQSGAEWAGRTIALYRLNGSDVVAEFSSAAAGVSAALRTDTKRRP